MAAPTTRTPGSAASRGVAASMKRAALPRSRSSAGRQIGRDHQRAAPCRSRRPRRADCRRFAAADRRSPPRPTASGHLADDQRLPRTPAGAALRLAAGAPADAAPVDERRQAAHRASSPASGRTAKARTAQSSRVPSMSVTRSRIAVAMSAWPHIDSRSPSTRAGDAPSSRLSAQQLARDAPPRRAERDAREHLAMAADAARQQQIRDVGASDQQNAADRAEQPEQRQRADRRRASRAATRRAPRRRARLRVPRGDAPRRSRSARRRAVVDRDAGLQSRRAPCTTDSNGSARPGAGIGPPPQSPSDSQIRAPRGNSKPGGITPMIVNAPPRKVSMSSVRPTIAGSPRESRLPVGVAEDDRAPAAAPVLVDVERAAERAAARPSP